jgi:hypothetical protein
LITEDENLEDSNNMTVKEYLTNNETIQFWSKYFTVSELSVSIDQFYNSVLLEFSQSLIDPSFRDNEINKNQF